MSWHAARSPRGPPPSARPSSPAGSPTWAAGRSARPLLAVAFVIIVAASIGFPGLAAFDARNQLVDIALDSPLQGLVFLATFLPLLYYGRLAAIGVVRPDPTLGDGTGFAGLPKRTPLDLTEPRASGAAFWSANRAPAAVLVALLVALLSLSVSAGGFGGPEAAAGLPPGGEGPERAVRSGRERRPGDVGAARGVRAGRRGPSPVGAKSPRRPTNPHRPSRRPSRSRRRPVGPRPRHRMTGPPPHQASRPRARHPLGLGWWSSVQAPIASRATRRLNRRLGGSIAGSKRAPTDARTSVRSPGDRTSGRGQDPEL